MFQSALQKLFDKLHNWLDSAIVMLPNIILAILVIIAFYILARILRRTIFRILNRFAGHEQINHLIGNVSVVITLALGILVALGVLNLDKTVTSILAGAGIVGIALGFAFQDFAANIISGTVLIIRRPFRIGDTIRTNDFTGMVERIDLRTTTLRTFQGQAVMIPNQKIFQNPITNFSNAGRRRVDIIAGVSYSDDLDKVYEITLAAVNSLGYIETEPPAQFFYKAFADSSITFEVQFWIDVALQPDYGRALSDALIAIKKAFDENGITIPFPVRTLEFGKDGVQGLPGAMPPVQ